MAGGRNKIHEHPKSNTNGFDKRPKQAGHPKKLISYVNSELENLGFTPTNKDEIVRCFLILVNLPVEKLNEISQGLDDSYPIMYRIVAKEMTGKRGLEMLEKLLDRAVGKATQAIDHTSKGKSLGEDMKEYFTLFEKEIEIGD